MKQGEYWVQGELVQMRNSGFSWELRFGHTYSNFVEQQYYSE